MPVNNKNENQHPPLPILPGSTVGILGGGQLGRMMILDGRKMGYKFVTLDPAEDCPAGQVSDIQIVSEYSSIQAAEQLARRSQVITYEFENVDAKMTQFLQERSYVPQGSELLHTTQHRLREKVAIEKAGVQVAPYFPVGTEQELHDGVDKLGLPCVLKTCTGGYDGKGQWLLKTTQDVAAAWSEIQTSGAVQPAVDSSDSTANDSPTEPGFILEKFVPFERELSVIVARNPSGEIKTFPTAENIHKNHILHLSIVPARVSKEVSERARSLAESIAASLELAGVMGVEMFLMENGELFVNELAPRPHNSGHYTLDACVTSQFEQHIRGICNLPLGSTELLSPVVMVNILGQDVAPVLAQLHTFPDTVKLHLYDKSEARVNRKMGHINVMAKDTDEALHQIAQFGIWDV
ncbi:5-(carboxyamino)imidazole ribonucleotide synthase [Alicyclobacillus sp. SO9]|uniref:5-(carboxyamino)imidazole ribonucleotide synthase n=1 Tax=Alicyclobacillus sp. SO9 TaxID=2665646 RepID=UPI0018E8D966|nr:5-(carboxyamino)imidazole ribonucleotide synthase [Alicyclobacillus sp. SO9]QQE81317.1 5-(carboxyamino)imidazole ribonucleotide synthase [Alicyclobacillus sp. SO9]